MKTSKLAKMFVALCAMSALVACGGSGQVDQRDQFVGAYSYKASGSLDFYAGDRKILSVPLNEEGTLTIAKSGDKDQVNIIGYNDTIRAKASGNTLILESNDYTQTKSGLTVQMHFTYGKATLTDNVLSWQSDVTGVGTYMGITANGNGSVSVVATKLQ